MARWKAGDDIDITKQELNDIKEALKKEEFRKLLNDYFEEVNDPKSKELYQKELTEFERERGVDITFINPEPGYVIKSSVDGKRKAFINICSNDKVDKPSSSIISKDGSPGLNWSIPYLQGHPRDDLDNKNVSCSVYDVVFHPDTLYLAKKNEKIKNLVEDIALSAVEDSFNVKIDRKNLAYPKIQYKGLKVATVIRKRRADYVDGNKEEDVMPPEFRYPYPPPPPTENIPKVTTPRSNYENDDSLYATPRYIIKHRRDIDMQEYTNSRDAKFHSAIPSNLVVDIDLPLIKCAADVKLDVVDKSLSLVSENPAKYKLDVNLPYLVDAEEGCAKFDKTKKKLIVTLPVKRSKPRFPDIVREDSGIESDPNQNNCSSSEEDIRKNIELLHENDVSVGKTSEERNVNARVVTRTSEEVKTQFLNPDFYYLLPISSVSFEENSLSLRIVVKNIDPQSVAHQFVCESAGVHLKFSSLGAGFFPIHYAICVKIPGITLDTASMNIDVWDNSLTAALKLKTDISTQITCYYVGTSLDSMEKKEIPLSFSESNGTARENIKEIVPEQEDTGSTNECDRKVEVNSELVIKAELLSQKAEIPEENINCDEELLDELQKASVSSSSPVKSKHSGTAIFKNRTLSESNELPESYAAGKRSILKGSRSLSESHTDDYNTWSSLDSESHDDLVASKKTVRFSDVVSKKIFRANSSILGQKKKNEKKSRNRKKAAYERMLSGGSEESGEECESVSEFSDVSSDDSSNGTLSSANTVVPSSKRHRRRGAKNQRKAAATAKQNHLPE